MLNEVPAELLDDLSAEDMKVVMSWWDGLTDLNRSEVVDLYDGPECAVFFRRGP